jgi:hypothetical protein
LQLGTPRAGTRCTPFYTILIELRQDPKVMLSRMKRDTRYDIRRASERERLLYEYWVDGKPEAVCEFANFNDTFAAQTGRPKLKRSRFELLAQSGVLDLSRVSDSDGEPLVWHAHYRGIERARLLESVSLYRSAGFSVQRTFVGRADRYHHWRDMLRLKEQEFTTYDLGGCCPGSEDAHRLGINAFKEEFGGTVVKNFNCMEGVTLKGKIAALVLSLMRPEVQGA